MKIKINKLKKKDIVEKKLGNMSSHYMDKQAKNKGYAGLFDIMIEDDDDEPTQKEEAKAGRVYRKTVRSIIKKIGKDVMDGSRTMPTEEELTLELPNLN